MNLYVLAIKSLWHRRVIMGLSLASIALSVALLVGVERVREGVRSSFSGTISQTDLIVGAPTGALQLLLYSVFNIGQGIAGIDYSSFERIREHPDVDWAVPFSLGDSYRGRRVFGTTTEYFERYRHHGDRGLSFSEGRAFAGIYEVVLGAEVARSFRHSLGDRLVLSHGVGPESEISVLEHSNITFEVVGILDLTSTPVDRSVYVSLQAIDALHVGWEDGASPAPPAPPAPGEEADADFIASQDLDTGVISGFFLRARSRLHVLNLQREIAANTDEPLMAIIPGVALAELWRNFEVFEQALRLISLLVMSVGLTSMFVAIYSTLQVRRREVSILRALGAGFSQITALFVMEAVVVSCLAAVAGVGLVYVLLVVGRPLLMQEFGISVALTAPGQTEALALGALLVLGSLVGFIPAVKAYRTALSDGLSVRL
jgi:putative ABC transport system permease protein